MAVLPQIEVRSDAELKGTLGAFSTQTQKIYLSESLLKGDLVRLRSVLIEEIGHFVDAQVNSSDSPGDEGAIFAALVLGKNLSDAELAPLKLEDDHGVIYLDDKKIAVEQQNFTGDGGNNNITGTSEDDLIEGLGGNDTLSGGAGNDTLDGGAGNDALNGGQGENLYLFGKGDGQDTINTYAQNTTGLTNILRFKAGVAPSEVVVRQVYDNYWGYQALQLSIAGTTDSVKLVGFFVTVQGDSAFAKMIKTLV